MILDNIKIEYWDFVDASKSSLLAKEQKLSENEDIYVGRELILVETKKGTDYIICDENYREKLFKKANEKGIKIMALKLSGGNL